MRALKFRELDQELQRERLLNIELSGVLGAAPHAAATLRRVEPRYEVPDHDAAEMADAAAAAETREPPAAARRDLLQETLTFPKSLPPWTDQRPRASRPLSEAAGDPAEQRALPKRGRANRTASRPAVASAANNLNSSEPQRRSLPGAPVFEQATAARRPWPQYRNRSSLL